MRKYKKNNHILQVLLPRLLPVISCIILCNSGDVAFADDTGKNDSKEIITKQLSQEELKMPDKDKLTPEEGEYLLSLARRTIESKLSGKEPPAEENDLPDKFFKKRGAFVTLNIHGSLRGCIGHIVPHEPLIDCIKINSLNAAFEDPRFRPLSKKEFEDIEIEISILTEPRQLEYSGADDLLEKLRPGTDGVIIKKNHYQSTFLPQVWEQLPDKKEFLSHLCLKAGMNAGEWKKGDLSVYTYQVQAFEEE